MGAALGIGAPAGLWLVSLLLGGLDGVTPLVWLYVTLATPVAFASAGWVAGRTLDKLQDRALRDGLTDRLNRRTLYDTLERELARTDRTGSPLSLLVLDLDRFKRVNDRHGHVIGDQTLVAVAGALTRSVRTGDVVARFGGEEFAVVLPETDEKAAVQVAERARREVEQLAPEALGFPGPQTVSIGVATTRVETAGGQFEFVTRADAAMYRAKAAGRNRVVADHPVVSEAHPGHAGDDVGPVLASRA